MEFVISSQQILTICTLIASIWGVVKIVQEIKKPNDDLKNLIKKHDELLRSDNERLKRLEETSQETLRYIQKDISIRLDNHEEMILANKERTVENEKINKLVLKSLLASINHDLTKNGYDKLKEAKDELVDYLCEK